MSLDASRIAAEASASDLSGCTLKEIVIAAELPLWLTARGAAPGVKCAKAESGIMVSTEVLTAAAVEALPRARPPSWLVRWLRATSSTFEAAPALVGADPRELAPATHREIAGAS
jgi:hypothetical protein